MGGLILRFWNKRKTIVVFYFSRFLKYDFGALRC